MNENDTMETILFQINNEKAYKLIEGLVELDIVKVLKTNKPTEEKLSSRFAGALHLSG